MEMPPASALRAAEGEVLFLWDEGLGSRQIARQTGLSQQRVRRILYTFSGEEEFRITREDHRKGSAALLAALDRSGANNSTTKGD